MASNGKPGGIPRKGWCILGIGVLLLLSIGVSVWCWSSCIIHDFPTALSDDEIPIIDPQFYSSETLCPDSLIENVFRPSEQSTETIPLLQQRIAIMREVGAILCNVRTVFSPSMTTKPPHFSEFLWFVSRISR